MNWKPLRGYFWNRTGLIVTLAGCGAAFALLLLLRFASYGVTGSTSRTVANPTTYSLWTYSLIASVGPYILAGLVLSLLALRLIYLLNSSNIDGGLVQGKLRSQVEGSSVVEFLLLLPMLLGLMLAILQIALIVQAKFVVNYAAFCAARSAVVTIPAKIRGPTDYERHNQIRSNDPDSAKMSIIQRAAALPCSAISPSWSASSGLSSALGTASGPLPKLALLFPASFNGSSLPMRFLTRAPYSFDKSNTSVEVSSVEGLVSGGLVPDHGLIRVRVTFRYYLTVPFANRLFGHSFSNSFWGASAWYMPITEEYTLPNEGDPLFPPDQERLIGDRDVEMEFAR